MNEKEYITYLLQEAKRLESIGQKGLAASRYEQVLEYEPENEEARDHIYIDDKNIDISSKFLITDIEQMGIEELNCLIDDLYRNNSTIQLSFVKSLNRLYTKQSKDISLFKYIVNLSKEEMPVSKFVSSFIAKNKLDDWSLATGTLNYIEKIINPSTRILEFGSGISTIFLAMKVKEYSYDGSIKILSIEQDINVVEVNNKILDAEGLADIAKILYAPLVPQQWKNYSFDGYDVEKYDELLRNFKSNVVLVDGHSGGGMNRLSSLVIASKYCEQNSIAILDNGLRDNEILLMDIVRNIGFNIDNIVFQGKGIGIGIFEKSKSEENFDKIQWCDIEKLQNIRLYAGDIPGDKNYENVIGLSITKSDRRHIYHDITFPIPLKDNSVNSYQSEDVFEHIEYDKLTAVIDEIYRILKPGGVFRLSVPDYGSDILINRSEKDEYGNIIFDPGGGGTRENPGHLWFPNYKLVSNLLNKTLFARNGKITFLHHYNEDGSFELKNIDYSIGFVKRTPDNDSRVKHPRRPLSLVVDLLKSNFLVSNYDCELFRGSNDDFELEYSIILTVYQKEKQIEKILNNLIINTSSPHELIIVFDGCNDKSEDIARNYLFRNHGLTERIKFIRTPDVNETKANNAGLSASRSKYSIILQDDMLITEYGWERRITYPLKVYNDVYAVGARSAHSFYFTNDNKVGYSSTVSAKREQFLIRDSVNRGPIAFKSDTIRELGFFDESYAPLYFDDMDIGIRAYLKLRLKCGVYSINWENLDSTVGSNTNKILSSGEKFSDIIHKNRELFWLRYHDSYKDKNHDEDRYLCYEKLNYNSKNNSKGLTIEPSLNGSKVLKYYSQGGEDKIVDKIFENKNIGNYIDVGAHDPIELSNTYHFYEKGWSGICLEPNIDLIPYFSRTRNRDKVLNIAAGDYDGRADFFFGEFTVHSSLKKSTITNNGTREVQVNRLESILDDIGFPREFEFISVDTEGTEIDVLQGLNLDKYSPRLIIAEYNTAGKIDKELQKFLLHRGYHVIFINKWNMIFSKEFEKDIFKIYL